MPVALNGAPKRTKPLNERSFAISLIKHPSEPVLDVGTGDCACVARVLAAQGMRVVALDKSHRTLLHARMSLNPRRLKTVVPLLQADITASGIGSGAFRNIMCSNVLHHVSRFDEALAELHRILASDGRLIISDYDEKRNGFLTRLEQAVNRHFRSVAARRRPRGQLVLICEK